MLKMKALNQSFSSDEDGSTIRKEAQEEITLDMYNKSLRLQSCGELLAAEDILQTIIEDNIPQLESQGGLPKTMSTLKYSCYVNLGSIAMKKQNLNVALENYLTASELDKTDVTLWYKIGTIALKLDKFKLASTAFAKGLECSDSHWPCLDQLISVLFALRDTVACLIYIGKALILDSNYVKGLVLRKNIYDCNPATKDYYQLYNPDYIYEPSLDIMIDKNDEIKYLEEAQKLCDRVNEIEKSLGAKPLSRIPLPKPLEEFTWLSMGLTLTELHKYVSDNNMSHFSFVDLKKCMSLNGETFETAILERIEKNNNNEECKYNDIEKRDDGGECANENIVKDESDKTPERRLSQASDVNTNCNATDVENSTPIQTDNDEMEQDIDDIDENIEQRTEKKTQNRATKRRRDLVSELQIWGWHNKKRYAKKAKVEKDFTIEDALKRIIPNRFLPNGIDENRYTCPDDSNTAMDVVTLKNEEELHNTFVNEQQIENSYFGSEQETADAQKFWFQTWVCCDVVNLIESYVYHISKLWKHKWPSQLISIYIDAYNMFREHVEHPKFCNNTNFEEFRNDALATLLYGELCTFNQIHGNNIHHTSLSFLQLISAWEDSWGEEHATFWCRVHWLRTHIFRKENQNLLAITALQLIQEVLASSETFTELSLLNCTKYGTISEDIVNGLLNNLEMMESLSQLEKLYDSQKYNEVANILKLTFSMSNPPTHGRMGRPAQLGMLLHSLWYTDTIDCFIWTEECLNESLKNFLRSQTNSDKWEMVVIKCLMFLNDIIKTETVTILDYLNPENRSRLIESLAIICCHQINTDVRDRIPLGTVIPWIILHYVLVREEHRQQAKIIVKRIKKDDDKLNKSSENEQTPVEHNEEDLPPSIAVLFSGHDFLGPKGWCLTNHGELLHFILDTIIDRLDTPIFESLREKIDIHLEQAFFCLYQHPSKKNKVSRHLADHSVNPLPLTWERAQQVCEFFCPNALPEFDSYKSISISGELEQLLQRISSLVPSECDPQPLVPKIAEFVDGASNTLPEPINFPPKTRSMYYLLGDYHFKQNEVIRSAKYFLLDLCINPLRLDTWACMALGIASQLETKLNHCEAFNTTEFLDKARGAQICYKKALSLANDHTTLWVEYGSFEYMVHAFCSRVSKTESDTLSMERFAAIETKKEELLNSCKNSFLRALELQQSDQIEVDERWLFHYVLGKIAEKHQKEPSEYLQHYLTAAALLNDNKATYPDKINYLNPPHLSIEALEIHYRINASILKYLELHEGKPLPDAIGKMFKQCLENSFFSKQEETQKVPSQEIENKNVTLDNEVHMKESAEAIKKQIEPDVTNDEVKKCIEDMLVQVESDVKQAEDVIKKECQSDVIMIEDSDEDNTTMKETKIKAEEKANTDVHGNIQDIMDAMMKETMDKTEETPMDIDPDITLQEVVISPESTVMKVEEGDVKVEVKEESSGEDVKSERTSDESIRKSVEETTSTSSSSSDSDSSDSDSDDSSSSTTSTTSSDNNGNLTDTEVLNLVDQCIAGLEQCIRRLPQNYKALYRLAHLYFHYNKKKDLINCKQLFLGEYKCNNGVIVSGLFSEHKVNNFFNGIWRIPSSEIDRPGSLASHMGRCVSLLLHVLHDTNDHKTLLDLCLQLQKVPDADKTYIRHSEREQLSDQALTLCIQSLRKQIKNIDNMSSFAKQKMLLDIYRIYQKSQKNLPFKESIFSGMLIDVFKTFSNEMAPENTNTLDLAVKYCQQNRAEKLKKQVQNLIPRSASVSSTNVPVLPTPSIISPPPSQPLKRPGLGRPRGRPPGPKIPGQIKSSRGRSPSSSSMWNKPYESTPYDYLKHYQKELLRQYHQTLTLTQQMSQLGSFLPPTSQNNLLNSVSFLQAMQQLTTGVNPLLLNQLMQNMNHNPGMMKNTNQMNTNVLKNISDMYKMPPNIPITSSVSQAMNSDHMRQLNNLAQTMNLPNLMSVQASPVVSTQPKTTFTIAKTSTNVSKLSTASNINKNINATFKYPTEIAKPKMKDVTKTTSSYVPKDSTIMLPIKSNTTAKETDKATSILKDRPNISITPVAQTITSVISPPKTVTATPPKTLQEKLADKQKQHKNIDKMSYMSSSPNKQFDKVPVMSISSNKALDFMSKVDKPLYTSSSTSSFKTSSLSNLNIPSSLNVFASFPKDSSYNINQAKPSETSLPSSRNEHPLSKIKISQSLDLPANLPMSLSVIRKPEDIRERKKSSDDDVIIIE